MEQTTRIPEANVPGLRAKLDALFARAARKGLTGFSVSWGEPYVVTEQADDADRPTIAHEYRDVTVTGEPPSLGGWQFVAVIEPYSPVNVLRVVPGFPHQLPERFRTGDASACEHCHARRNRSETFIVWHAERDEYRQVGRQCIRDFTGHDPAKMLSWASFLPSIADAVSEFGEGGSGFRSAPMHDVAYLLALAARVVAVDGWRSRSSDPERCTANTISTYLWATQGNSRSDEAAVLFFIERYTVSARSTALLARVMARVEELKAKGLADLRGDYEVNLWTVLTNGWVSSQHIGLVASMLAYAVKAEQQEAERAGLPDMSASTHVGSVGQRLRGIHAVVTFTRVFESDFGAKTLVKMAVDGNSLTWWATGCVDLRAGEEITLTGTVKAHDTDRFDKRPTTILSRCKFEKSLVTA